MGKKVIDLDRTAPGDPVPLASYLVMPDATSHAERAVLQADVSSVTGYVYETSAVGQATSFNQVGSSFSITVASAISDTLSTGSAWTQGSPGFNFLYTVAGTYFPKGNTTYLVRVKYTFASGNVFNDWFRTKTHDVATP